MNLFCLVEDTCFFLNQVELIGKAPDRDDSQAWDDTSR